MKGTTAGVWTECFGFLMDGMKSVNKRVTHL